MLQFLLCVCLVTLSCQTVCFGQNNDVNYVIVAPKVFRPSSVYNVTATCYNVKGRVNLSLRIQATDTNNVLVEKQTVLASGVTQTISLQVPDEVPETTYSLVVVGRGGLSFNDSHEVSVKRKTLSIFVQTDKAMYKPGQTVLLRAIIVYPDLKPYQGLVDIEVYDPVSNKITQWLKQRNDTGVIGQRLPLSDQTPLGDWQIAVTAGENSFKKTFQVAEYVLPKFEVTVTLPSYYLVNFNRKDLQKDLPITVTAKYTYGQPVKGRANVAIQLQPYYAGDPTNYTTKTMDVQLLDGKADINVPIKDLLYLVPVNTYDSRYTVDLWNSLSYRSILVVASVNETVTGIVLSGNGTVACTSNKYTLKFLDSSPSNYKPGLLYTGYFQLAQQDGSLPESADISLPGGGYKTISVQVTKNYIYQYSGTYVPPEIENFNVTIDPTGYMNFSLTIDKGFDSVDLQCIFYVEITNSTVYGYKSINAFKSRDNQSIQVSFDSQDGVITDLEEITLTVKTTDPIQTFQYELLSKGSILLSGTFVGNLSDEHSLSVRIPKNIAVAFAPSARVVVWFITDYGEIIADSTEAPVGDIFANKVSLSFDREKTTPSQNVSLTVSAYRGSYVGLLAVDQSVLLLKGGNDITQDMVAQDLKGYDSVSNDYPMWLGKRRKRSIRMPYYIGGADSQTILSNAGVFVMTDGYLYKSTFRYPFYAAGGPNKGSVPANAPADSPPDSQTRINFPETWLWSDAVVGSDGNVTIQTSVPDTITSWIASAFAVSQVTGLGVAPNTAKLTVFKQFFLSPNLPYSIIRGEEFALQVTVFNYMSIPLDVVVNLQESPYYKVQGSTSVSTQVNSTDAVSVYFWIVAGSLGQIPIYISGTSPFAGDSMRVMLLVKPEGVQQQYSTSVFVQLPSSGSTYNTTMDVSLPPVGKLVPGSEYIEVTVIGDLMGPSVQGLDNLLQMPYGCGEQNMLNFAPDVYIVDYLTVSNQLTPEIKSKALGFMNAGYQRELTYQRSDGSFSAFGNSDQSGSVWLSSFVIKCFHQAKDYIPVDDAKIANTMRWIISNQAKNGSFSEPPMGRVIHEDMQGGSSEGLPMTAYVLIALLENQNNSQFEFENITSRILLTRNYLETEVKNASSDPYALSIIAYALVRAGSSKVNEVLQMLERLAIVTAGTRHWEKASENTGSPDMLWRPPYSQARSVNIEMTSYALLTYTYMKNLSMSLPIVKWIVAQRNANGGFSSTQDTVMALEALAEFSAMILGPSSERNLQVSAKSDLINHDFLPITAETSILLQSFEFPSNSTKIYITTTGKGSALVQLNVKYNVYQTDDVSGINLKVNTTQNGNKISIKSCSSWTKNEGSGMVVMEIKQLTGFKASNLDDLKNQANNVIKRVDSTDDNVVLYFDQLNTNETCVDIISEKVFPVSNVKDAPVKVYPYYDPSGGRTQFYGAPEALGQNTACTECPECCKSDTTMPDTVTSRTDPADKPTKGADKPKEGAVKPTKDDNKQPNVSPSSKPLTRVVALAIVLIQICFTI